MKKNNKPTPPLSQIIAEGTVGSCPKCGSTERYKHDYYFFKFGGKIGCIQPECENYWKKNIA